MRTLWNDECGAVMAAEMILIITVLTIGMIVGLKAVQIGIVSELDDVAHAISSIDQSFGDYQDNGSPFPANCEINFNVTPSGGG